VQTAAPPLQAARLFESECDVLIQKPDQRLVERLGMGGVKPMRATLDHL